MTMLAICLVAHSCKTGAFKASMHLYKLVFMHACVHSCAAEAVETLREDLPCLFVRDPRFHIFREDLTFR